MNRKRISLFAVLGFVLIISVYFAVTYNRLVKEKAAIQLAYSELQNVYQRRLDLIPGLVNIVKGAAAFEQSLLEEIAAARSRAASAASGGYAQTEAAQGNMVQSVNRLLLIVEAYPDLKASKSFLYLQSQLEGTERRIKFSRKDLNAAVNQYNTTVRQFPSSLVASLFDFKPEEGFRADKGAENAPVIEFKKSTP
jgi:LemA protein